MGGPELRRPYSRVKRVRLLWQDTLGRVGCNKGALVYAGVIMGREDDAPEYHGYFVTYAQSWALHAGPL